jgi:MFS family permease
MAIISILGRFSFGWFGDRYDKRWLTGFGLAMSGISMPFLIYAGESIWLLVPFSFFFGIGFGGPVPMTSALLRDYFGRYRLGTILGVVMGLMMIGNVLGPPLTGWVYDTYGSYNGAWFAYIFILIAGIISFMTAPKRIPAISAR